MLPSSVYDVRAMGMSRRHPGEPGRVPKKKVQAVSDELVRDAQSFAYDPASLKWGRCARNLSDPRLGLDEDEIRASGMRPHEQRDKTVHTMGFASYVVYVKSALHARVRQKALADVHYKCSLCNGRAGRIHFAAYDKQTLRGEDLSDVHALCSSCEDLVKINPQGKRASVAVAQDRFRHLQLGVRIAKNRDSGPKKPKKKKKHRSDHGRPICRRCTRAPAVRRCGNLCIPCHDYVQSQSADWNNA